VLLRKQAAQLNGNGSSTAHQQVAAAAAGISRPSGPTATLTDEDVNGMQLDGIQLEQQQQPTGLYVRVSAKPLAEQRAAVMVTVVVHTCSGLHQTSVCLCTY
jgi:hypothetical protein